MAIVTFLYPKIRKKFFKSSIAFDHKKIYQIFVGQILAPSATYVSRYAMKTCSQEPQKWSNSYTVLVPKLNLKLII